MVLALALDVCHRSLRSRKCYEAYCTGRRRINLSRSPGHSPGARGRPVSPPVRPAARRHSLRRRRPRGLAAGRPARAAGPRPPAGSESSWSPGLHALAPRPGGASSLTASTSADGEAAGGHGVPPAKRGLRGRAPALRRRPRGSPRDLGGRGLVVPRALIAEPRSNRLRPARKVPRPVVSRGQAAPLTHRLGDERHGRRLRRPSTAGPEPSAPSPSVWSGRRGGPGSGPLIALIASETSPGSGSRTTSRTTSCSSPAGFRRFGSGASRCRSSWRAAWQPSRACAGLPARHACSPAGA